MLVHYAVPGRYDSAPYGTPMKVIGDADTFTFYIQISDEPEIYNWVKSGEFFELLFNDKFETDNDFLANICNDYRKHMDIQKILKKSQ